MSTQVIDTSASVPVAFECIADNAGRQRVFPRNHEPWRESAVLARNEVILSAVVATFEREADTVVVIRVEATVASVFQHQRQFAGSVIEAIEIGVVGITLIEADQDFIANLAAGFLDRRARALGKGVRSRACFVSRSATKICQFSSPFSSCIKSKCELE